MMRYFLLFFTVFLLLSCQHNVCDCVEAGKKVNEISSSFFNRDYSVEGKDSLDRAIKDRDEICQPFNEMSAAELQKEAAECENLTIEVD